MQTLNLIIIFLKNADFKVREDFGKTSPHYALESGTLKSLKILITYKAMLCCSSLDYNNQ
jgi:hypothetical protein